MSSSHTTFLLDLYFTTSIAQQKISCKYISLNIRQNSSTKQKHGQESGERLSKETYVVLILLYIIIFHLLSTTRFLIHYFDHRENEDIFHL